ncbi:MAG: YwaF family protein [Bacilli bacterium]|nr:YwaF family protein [Bacilli bacterium]
MSQFWSEFFRITEDWNGEYFGIAHIIVSSLVTVAFIGLGVFFGLRLRGADEKRRMRPIRIATIIFLAVQLTYYIVNIVRDGWADLVSSLPLFLCDIQLFSLPLAAWGKGRLQKIGFDFSIVLGLLAALMGAWFNAAVFSNNPIWSYDVIWNYVNHCVPGFISIYIVFGRFTKLHFKDMLVTFAVMLLFEGVALLVDFTLDENYMFFRSSSGTPFSIFETIAAGNQVVYVILVILGMHAYVAVYYLIYFIVEKVREAKAKKA